MYNFHAHHGLIYWIRNEHVISEALSFSRCGKIPSAILYSIYILIPAYFYFSVLSRICGDHFLKEDIIDTWVSGQGTSKYSIYRFTGFIIICSLSILPHFYN
ncbi:bromodomain-containing protein DDB G0270170-like [Aphis craccivora]|uniref:Bromodomain-containing protein DDB G0270170-like n=1 Tax=Aphis craccivora TaxID=307492 RepID=A0A6G0W3E5_APHCR|nr:bromodomain-containing protein DDB G0270170-like [Aphis craccivora]